MRRITGFSFVRNANLSAANLSTDRCKLTPNISFYKTFSSAASNPEQQQPQPHTQPQPQQQQTEAEHTQQNTTTNIVIENNVENTPPKKSIWKYSAIALGLAFAGFGAYQLLNGKPVDPEYMDLISQVEEAFYKGEYERVRELTHKMAKLDPEHPMAYFYMGNVELNTRNLDAALNAYNLALHKCNMFRGQRELVANIKGLIYANIALIYVNGAEYEKSLEYFQQAESFFDKGTVPATFKNSYARALLSLGKPAEAKRKLVELLIERPHDIGTVISYVDVCISYPGDDTELKHVTNLAKSLVDALPERPEGYAQYGWLVGARGEYEEGLKYLKKAIEKAPRNPAINHKYATLQLLSGKPTKETTQCLKVAYDNEPKQTDLSTNICMFLALSTFLQGNQKESDLYLKEASARNPHIVNALRGFVEVSKLSADQKQKFVRNLDKFAPSTN